MIKQTNVFQKIYRWTNTYWAFLAVVGLFLLGALWIALSGRYSMAFDEDFHTGIIRIYSQNLSPFLSSQSSQADAFGAMYRDPSFLFHYLMSFPWRLITFLFHGEMSQIITLRLLNVALFTWGLFIWRRVLGKTMLSGRSINVILLVFVLTPVIPLLAAQINYDNLLFPLSGLFILSLQSLTAAIKRRQWNSRSAYVLVMSGLAGILTKYAFLPIFIIGVVVVLYYLNGWRREDAAGLIRRMRISYRSVPMIVKIVGGLSLLILIAFAVQRYGLNFIRFGTPVPECDQVIGIQRCQAYSPWARNYYFLLQKTTFDFKPFWYVGFWLSRMLYSLTFTVNGLASNFAPGTPLALPKAAFVLASGLGLTGLLIHFKTIKKAPYAWLFGSISALYMLVLFLQNINEYIHLGNPVAIQGRYLLPVLLLVYYLVFISARALVGSNILVSKILVFTILAGFLLGGGALTFIARSDSSWYWENRTVIQMNDRARKAVHTLIPYSN